jgi:YidC/Oxa1 family membrane protein insertase
MNDLKSLFLAISLSVVVLFAWQYFFVAPDMQKAHIQQAKVQEKQRQEAALLIQRDAPLPREELIEKAPRVKIATDHLHGSISLRGARIDDLTLARFRQELDPKSPEFVLLSPSGGKQIYFAEFGWLSAMKGVTTPNSNTVWRADKAELKANDSVTFTWQSPQALTFAIRYSLDDHYMFTIKQWVENRSGDVVSVAPYALVNRSKDLAAMSSHSAGIAHEGPLAVANEVLTEFSYSGLKDDEKASLEDVSGWFGISDKYWLTAIVPEQQGVNVNFKYFEKNKQDRFQVDYLGKPIEVGAEERVGTTTYFYAGAKKIRLLDKYSEELNIALFDRAIDFGWLYVITRPIFLALIEINEYFGNFGIAILVLTVFIKLLMFPLAQKSFHSMNKLKKLQPEMLKIRERYKDDKMRMQQEIMDFYKREKVNPASGCLPILLQLPIFFALYKVLYVTIEMRHAPFFGWIQDLSVPDPTTVFNLFGLLPYDVPSFLMIGAWPMIMMISMVVQQMLNPPPPDPTQAKVMRAMPFIFVFIFAQFPAGLVIYWAWSNILSIIQQRFMAKGIEKD